MNALYSHFDFKEIFKRYTFGLKLERCMQFRKFFFLSKEPQLKIWYRSHFQVAILQAAADFGFLVPYFDREVIRFPTPPYAK